LIAAHCFSSRGALGGRRFKSAAYVDQDGAKGKSANIAGGVTTKTAPEGPDETGVTEDRARLASSASFLRLTKNPTQFFVADTAARLIAFINVRSANAVY
jgi:hypothetical protein